MNKTKSIDAAAAEIENDFDRTAELRLELVESHDDIHEFLRDVGYDEDIAWSPADLDASFLH